MLFQTTKLLKTHSKKQRQKISIIFSVQWELDVILENNYLLKNILRNLGQFWPKSKRSLIKSRQ